jgi:hypothetical protein
MRAYLKEDVMSKKVNFNTYRNLSTRFVCESFEDQDIEVFEKFETRPSDAGEKNEAEKLETLRREIRRKEKEGVL